MLSDADFIAAAPIGRCFDWAYRYMNHHDDQPDLVLVHAMVEKDGRRFWHAWVEDGDVVRQEDVQHPQSPVGLEFDRDIFYDVTAPSDIRRFDHEQMLIAMLRFGHMGPWREVQKPTLRPRRAKAANRPTEYPRAGAVVDGRTVRAGPVDNTGSIAASLTDYTVLPGIREVPMTDFYDAGYRPRQYSVSEQRRVDLLAEEIQFHNEIAPLIVVVDRDGPYVLEGAHRLNALQLLGARSFPALVVRDDESLGKNVTEVTAAMKPLTRAIQDVFDSGVIEDRWFEEDDYHWEGVEDFDDVDIYDDDALRAGMLSWLERREATFLNELDTATTYRGGKLVVWRGLSLNDEYELQDALSNAESGRRGIGVCWSWHSDGGYSYLGDGSIDYVLEAEVDPSMVDEEETALLNVQKHQYSEREIRLREGSRPEIVRIYTKHGTSLVDIADEVEVELPVTVTAANEHAFDNIDQDVDDAIEYASESYETEIDPRSLRLERRVDFPTAELRGWDDLSSWLDIEPGELVGLDDEQLTTALTHFRGAEWARRAMEWIRNDSIPAIVLIDLPTVQCIGDGRGRVNLALGLNLPTIPAVIVTERAVTARLIIAGEEALADQLASADLAEADNVGSMPWREALKRYTGYIHFSKAPYYQRRYSQPKRMERYHNAPGIYFYDGHTLLYGDVGHNVFASDRPYFIIADIDTTNAFDCGRTSDSEVSELVTEWRLMRLFDALRSAVMDESGDDDGGLRYDAVQNLRDHFHPDATEATWLFILVRGLIDDDDGLVGLLTDVDRSLSARDFPRLTWRSTFMRDFTCIVDSDHPDIEGVSGINDDIPRQVIVFDPSIITPVAWGRNTSAKEAE